jgi:hypothetical protein
VPRIRIKSFALEIPEYIADRQKVLEVVASWPWSFCYILREIRVTAEEPWTAILKFDASALEDETDEIGHGVFKDRCTIVFQFEEVDSPVVFPPPVDIGYELSFSSKNYTTPSDGFIFFLKNGSKRGTSHFFRAKRGRILSVATDEWVGHNI